MIKKKNFVFKISSLLVGTILATTLPSISMNETKKYKTTYEKKYYSNWNTIKTNTFKNINNIDDFLTLELKITKKSGVETKKVKDLSAIKHAINGWTGTSNNHHWAELQININDQIDNIEKIELIQGYKNDTNTNILDLTELSKKFLKSNLNNTNIINKLIYDFDVLYALVIE